MSQYWGTGRLGTHQSVAFTGTAGTIANAVANGTQKVRVLVTTDAYIKIGVSPTATTSDVYVTGLAPEYFTITSGEKVSAIQVSSGGSLHVTEVS
jgi:hypothetical protein